MARLITSKCRECRKMGEKLFARGERCYSPKCALTKRAYAPGAQGKKTGGRRKTVSEFGKQLMQKQRVKKLYGVLERQLLRYFAQAQSQKGDARENLMRIFETRLDNVVFRLGWANSRPSARQLVNHGHVSVNGKRLNIPSYEVKIGDVISLRDRIKKSPLTGSLSENLKKYETPSWMVSDIEKLEAKIISMPSVDELGDLAPIGLIVEFYSR